jgi:hypothetical protein
VEQRGKEAVFLVRKMKIAFLINGDSEWNREVRRMYLW